MMSGATDPLATEELWRHLIAEQMQAVPEEVALLLMEPPMNPKSERERTIQLAFESLQVPFCYLACTSPLVLHSTGDSCGCVLESRDDSTWCIPIYEGFVEQHAVKRVPIAGKDITRYCHRILCPDSDQEPTQQQLNTAETLKRLYAGCPASACASESSLPVSHSLPDGTAVAVTPELRRAGCAMFEPSLIGLSCPPVHESAYASILACDASLRKEMYQHLIISGGNTRLMGFQEMLQDKVRELAPRSMKVVVRQADRGQCTLAPWVGGSLLAAACYSAGSESQHDINTMWISKAMYDEHGPAIVHQRCF